MKDDDDVEKSGGPAFPVGLSSPAWSGMTLRDWFAGLALLGELIDEGIEEGRRDEHIDLTCWSAYRYADAMLKEREK